MTKIPTLYSDYKECILDLDIYGKIVATPQQSIQELTDTLFEEFKRRKPLPTLEYKRYELSRLVNPEFRIAYNKELELQDNERLVDLDKSFSTLGSIQFEDLTPLIDEVREAFSYEMNITDSVRQDIISKYDLETGEEFKPGIQETENIVGTTYEDSDTVLTDEEIENLGVDEDYSVLDINEDDTPEQYEDESDIEVDDDFVDYDAEEDSTDDTESEDDDDSSFEDYSDDTEDTDEADFDDYSEEQTEDDADFSDYEEEQSEDEDDYSEEPTEEDDYSEEPAEEDDSDLDSSDDYSEEEQSEDEDDFSDYDAEESSEDDTDFSDYESEEDSDDFSDYEEQESEDDSDDFADYEEESEDDSSFEDYEEEESDEIYEEDVGDSDEDSFDEYDYTEETEIDEDYSEEPSFIDSVYDSQNQDEQIAEPVKQVEVQTPVTPAMIHNEVPKPQVIDRSAEPTDIRAFLRKHPRCEYEFALQYFTKKQINDAIKIGKIIKKGNILKI